jgi:hypothetical protein
MAAKADLSRVNYPSAQTICAAKGGCSYLNALSTIEQLAGFEQTARSYAEAAARCREQGCWAAPKNNDDAAWTFGGTKPIPFRIAARPRQPCLYPSTVDADVILFARSFGVDIVADNEGNYVERRLLTFESLPKRGDPLGYLFRYWRHLRTVTDCKLSNIDTVHIERAEILGKMHIVDVSSSDPREFRFELSGYAIPLGRYERPQTLPVPIYAETAMRDYNTVRLVAAPRLHRVRSRLSGVNYHYTRLILPFLNAQGRVDRLLVAIRQEPGDGVKVEAGD